MQNAIRKNKKKAANTHINNETKLNVTPLTIIENY